MRDRRARQVILLIAVLLALTLCALLTFLVRKGRALTADLTIGYGPHNVYDRTLVITANQDYDPYSFIDAQGAPCGHDIELIYMLADEMGYNTEIRLLPLREALTAAAAGQVDLVLTVPLSREDPDGLALSVPLVNDPFVAFGRRPYKRIGELYASRIAVLEGTGCIEGFIEPYRLTLNTAAYSSNSEAFAAVMRGERDYAVARYSVGRRAIANGAEGLDAVGPTLLDNYLCIGVRADDPALLAALNDAIVRLSADGTIGMLTDKWLGQHVQTLTAGEYVLQNLDKALLLLGVLLLLFLLGFLIVTRTVSAQKEDVLKRLAEHDQLTGLYNRATCESMIREMLNVSDPATDRHALLVVDMDNFKQINDEFGHMEGDDALRRLASGLRQMFRSRDIVGRLGGDEFFVFMPGCTEVEVAVEKAEKICLSFGDTYSRGGVTFDLSASVGIARYPAQGTEFAALYKAADDALYDAKRHGKKGCAYYGADGARVYCRY